MIKPWEPSGITAECVNPQRQDVCHALDKKQVLWRYKNNRIQVLAQTLSNYLDTRTSSLLAVNKKQGVPRKFIHREWKRTWVDLEGLKQRVQRTEHGSALLKGLKQVIQVLDAVTTPDDQLVESKQKKQKKPAKSKPTVSKQDCPAVALAYRNSADIADLSTCVHDLDTRAKALEYDMPQLLKELSYHNANVTSLKKRVDRIEKTDKQATEAAVNRTLLGDLNTRLGRIATQADSLDSRADGMESRISVVEDTSKWLSWALAGMIGLRFLGLMLRWLRRK